MTESNSELEKFNAMLRKVLSVPREELLRREAEWKRNQAQKKNRRNMHDNSTKKND
jgi:hypothetical protein